MVLGAVSGGIAGGDGIAGWIGTIVEGCCDDLAGGGPSLALGNRRSPFEPHAAIATAIVGMNNAANRRRA